MQAPLLAEIPRGRWSSTARSWFDARGIDRVVTFQIGLTTTFRGVRARRGVLLRGPGGWGECAPFKEYGAAESALWLKSAAEAATWGIGVPAARGSVPVNVTIPVVSPQDAAGRAHAARCSTAKIKVADPHSTLREDWDRVRAVAVALAQDFGSQARVRIDVNGKWEPDQAVDAIAHLCEAAAPVGGLEYVEQPCMKVEDLARVRQRVGVPIAADESIRRADDPFRVVECEAADLAVIKVAPLAGVRRALDLALQLPIPVVVSSAIDTSIGLAAGVALAAALPDLPHACGLDTQRLLVGDVAGPLISRDGQLSLSDARAVASGDLLEPELGEGASAASLVDEWTSRAEAMIAACASEETA